MGRKLKLTIEVDIDRVSAMGGMVLLGNENAWADSNENYPDFTVHPFGWKLSVSDDCAPIIHIKQEVGQDGKAPMWVGTPAETASPAMPKLETSEANLTEKSSEIKMGGGANLNGEVADSNILIN